LKQSWNPLHNRKKELHVFGVEEYTDVFEYLRYSVDKPEEAKWFQMISLDILDTLRHLIQQQLSTRSKAFEKSVWMEST
jgi:hypothetical protein